MATQKAVHCNLHTYSDVYKLGMKNETRAIYGYTE